MASSAESSPSSSLTSDAQSASSFEPCEDRRYFERRGEDLAPALLGQYLYCHGSGILLQVTEVEAYSDSPADAVVYQGYFRPPLREKVRVKAGQLLAILPHSAWHVDSRIDPDAPEALELYITAGTDEHCGDVVRLKSVMPFPGQDLSQLEKRLDEVIDDPVGRVIDSSDVPLAFGASKRKPDWEANPFLFQPGGVQLHFLRGSNKGALEEPRLMTRGRRDLDEERVGHKPQGYDAELNFALNIDPDTVQRR